MPTAAEHIASLYQRVDELETRIKELELRADGMSEEIDLPLPTLANHTTQDPPKGVRGVWDVDGKDLDDLDPGEREAAEAARARLANEKGGTIEDPIPEGERAKSDGEVVDIPPTSDEVREQRRLLAEAIRLADDFGDEGVDAYIKGGPLWLYYGNREYVLGLGPNVWTAMVEDVSHTSPQEAVEMGRDLFKVRGASSEGVPGWSGL